jgi:DNA-binding transcriptional MocR family regulator
MAKHQPIQDVRTEGIRNGEFPPASRLPSERELAVRFGVSYLTARHAVAQLVEANLLERRAQIIRVQDGDERSVLRAVQSGDPVLAMVGISSRTDELAIAMQQANGRAVLVTNRMDDIGIPSVVADNTQALRLAITHLQEHGHRQIALLCGYPAHPIARVQVAAWRAWCSSPGTVGRIDDRLRLIEPRLIERQSVRMIAPASGS